MSKLKQKQILWECGECGEMHDALVAWIDPDKLKLYHVRENGAPPIGRNRCGPLLEPKESERLRKLNPDRKSKRSKPRRPRVKKSQKIPKWVKGMKDPERYCEICGSEFKRNRYKSGRLENRAKFFRRRTCSSKKCLTAMNRLTSLEAVGKANGSRRER